ncbi:MAG: ATP-binding protein [Thermodesulfobacteriota bacterium]
MVNNKDKPTCSEAKELLFAKIKWLMFFRAVVATILLGATAFIQIKENQLFHQLSPQFLYVLIVIIYVLTIFYTLLLPRLKHLKAFAYGQLLGDVLFVTILIYLTGGIESIFSWVYLLPIFGASTILYRRGGLFIASASAILYGVLLDLEYYQIIFPTGSRLFLSHEYKGTYVFYLLAMNMLAFYLVALLSAYLAEQLRRKEEELKERITDYSQLEKLYEHIVQNVASGLITVNAQGFITSFNKMAEEITDLKFAEVYQRQMEDLFPGFLLKKNLPAFPSAKEGKKSQQGRWETKFQRKDGTVLTLGFSVSPLKDSQDNEIGTIFIFQDLTKIREMEEDLKRADRLAAIGTMAAGLAHEIRNPLASISGSIEILREEMDGSGQSHKLMDIVLREIGRLDSLIADFLLFARPSSPQKNLVHLNKIINELLQVVSNSPECRPEINFFTKFEEEVYLLGDEQQLKQAFWNLLINALQAMPGGGEINITLRRFFANDQKEPGQAEIIISDTGVGIKESDLDKIFNPFFTTKEQGTGLGLSIVHRIIEVHGGKISVQSRPNKGTIFRITLPIT